jgi:hypothetical protein
VGAPRGGGGDVFRLRAELADARLPALNGAHGLGKCYPIGIHIRPVAGIISCSKQVLRMVLVMRKR